MPVTPTLTRTRETGEGEGQNTDSTSGTLSGRDDASDGGSDAKFDVAPGDPPLPRCDPGDEDCGCTAVDLLFIVDNSLSMNWLIPPLNGAFPEFVDDMFSVLPPGTDLHVAIARGSGYFDPGNASGSDDPVTCVDPIVRHDARSHSDPGACRHGPRYQGRMWEQRLHHYW